MTRPKGGGEEDPGEVPEGMIRLGFLAWNEGTDKYTHERIYKHLDSLRFYRGKTHAYREIFIRKPPE